MVGSSGFVRSRVWVLAPLLVVLTACGGDAEVSGLTLYQAKEVAQTGESDVIAAIPDELIASVDQRPAGSLLSCTGERNFQWAGGTTVHVAADTDLDAVIDGVSDAYTGLEAWELTRDTAPDGAPIVTLYRVTTGGYLVSGEADRSMIEIYSFSPCFHLPDDMTPHGSY